MIFFSRCFQALSEIESEDLVQEERARKAAVRKSKMDADLDAESADLQEKKGVSSCRISWGIVYGQYPYSMPQRILHELIEIILMCLIYSWSYTLVVKHFAWIKLTKRFKHQILSHKKCVV